MNRRSKRSRDRPPLTVTPPRTPRNTSGAGPSISTPTSRTAAQIQRRNTVPDSPHSVESSIQSEGSAASRVSVLATGTLVPVPRAREKHPSHRPKDHPQREHDEEEGEESQSSADMEVILFPGDHGGDRGGDNISQDSASITETEIHVTSLGGGQLGAPAEEGEEGTVQSVGYSGNYYLAAAARPPGGLETYGSPSFDLDDLDVDPQHGSDQPGGDRLGLVGTPLVIPVGGVETEDLLQPLVPGAHGDEEVPMVPTLIDDEPNNDELNKYIAGRRKAAAMSQMQPLVAAGGPNTAGIQADSVAYAAASLHANRRRNDLRVVALCLAFAVITFVAFIIIIVLDDDDSRIIGPELPTTNVTIAPSIAPSLTRSSSSAPSRTQPSNPSFAPTPGPSIAPVLLPSPNPSPTPSQTPGFSEEELLGILTTFSFDDGEALSDPSSPQFAAFEWLAGNANLDSYSIARILQRHALATFYFSTNGSQWSENELWLSDEDECSWFSRARAVCGPGGQFRRLQLYFNNAQGGIPPEIALLSTLERIDISGGPDRRLSGTLPTELGLLIRLKDVKLQNNDLVGSIPPQYGAWEDLDLLDLSKNQLNSTLPTEIGMWASVTTLDFAGNRLTGSIGSQIGEWPDLQIVSFDDNLFTGPLPTEVGTLKKLAVFSVNRNQLASLPSEIALCDELRFLSLEDNEFSGTLPTELGQLQQLISLSVARNSFVGPIPSELGGLRGLREKLDLSENKFSGRIPSELGQLNGKLRILFLRDNLLTGPVPAELAQLERVNVITLDSNSLTGSMPVEACNDFNKTQPAIFIDCEEVFCPCCNFCCRDGEDCVCRYIDTDDEFLCYF
jgi:Leucine-rich repeat (LRR) protein